MLLGLFVYDFLLRKPIGSTSYEREQIWGAAVSFALTAINVFGIVLAAAAWFRRRLNALDVELRPERTAPLLKS